MSDLISRQSAIDAHGEKPLSWTDGEYELALQQQWEADVDAIKAVPSAQPDRKKGKWETAYLPHEYMGCRPTAYYCSECNQITTFRTFYCPNCGADMRLTEREHDE